MKITPIEKVIGNYALAQFFISKRMHFLLPRQKSLQSMIMFNLFYLAPNLLAFFKHNRCIYDNVIGAKDNIACNNNYLLGFDEIARTISATNTNDWFAAFCCAHNRKEVCSDKLVREKCGTEAEEAFRIYYDHIHFGAFSFCSFELFDPDSEKCTNTLPPKDAKPRGAKSVSKISRFLYKYYPFNYKEVNIIKK